MEAWHIRLGGNSFMVSVETDDETANELSLPYLIEGLIRCAIDERALTDRH